MKISQEKVPHAITGHCQKNEKKGCRPKGKFRGEMLM